jgi:cation diffusion facilitator CzcD-associated flavoprotein CzcO
MPSVAIIGAGMSGLCLAVKLRQAGVEDFTIYEKAGEVGGTWRENRYPGLCCDVPSRYYSYSFAPNPDWSRWYAPGGEIQRYLEGVADRYGLRSKIRFETEVRRAAFAGDRWRIGLADGREEEAAVLVSACGILHHPREPELEGRETFEGRLFHSARWEESTDLRGRRVAVVGTGSTGVQIVSAVAGEVGKLTLFQRTAQWVFWSPNPGYRAATRRLMRRFPALTRLGRAGYQAYVEKIFGRAVVQPGWQRRLMSLNCRLHLRTVRDRELRRKLTPDYHPMCKRLVFSPSFYRAVQRPNVEVVTDGIERLEARGIRTRDGRLHEADVVVLATGFDAHAYLRPIELVGEDGVTLEDSWADGVRAYRSIALPGFPNFFIMLGPHSPVGNQSLITISEAAADYIVGWVERLRRGAFATAVPTIEATERFNAEVRAAMPNTVWITGCKSWYLGTDGQPELWPWPPERHTEMLREPALAEFELRPAVAATTQATPRSHAATSAAASSRTRRRA